MNVHSLSKSNLLDGASFEDFLFLSVSHDVSDREQKRLFLLLLLSLLAQSDNFFFFFSFSGILQRKVTRRKIF